MTRLQICLNYTHQYDNDKPTNENNARTVIMMKHTHKCRKKLTNVDITQSQSWTEHIYKCG